MTEVLRLHKSGDNTITDWMESTEINIDQVNEITDPDGATCKKEITSIPSPFARIDLTLTAYEEVLSRGLDGETIFHKMVSDSLDVGEIFFNIRRYSDKFQIIYWDKNDNINELLKSDDVEHQAVGKTLEIFINQDKDTYNFDKMNRIFMLNYIGPDRPAQLNIVGATSPCTLFFSSANDLSYISEHIAFGADRAFDGKYCALYKRDFEFIKYLWLFKNNYKGFERDFKTLNTYLEETYKKLSTIRKDELDNLDKNIISEYDEINIENVSNSVEILNHSFHQRSEKVTAQSDFEIVSNIYSGVSPLVLPIETGNTYTKLVYVNDTWTNSSKAPIYDYKSLEDRTLPILGNKYPYITIGDFLSDTIIKTPFELNSLNYFDGNMSDSDFSYLLPLTELFFQFFSVDELMGELEGGKKMIELRENVGGISVTLRIPIKGNKQVKYIEYQRSYFTDYIPNSDINKGTVVNKTFGLGIFPFTKFDTITPHYRIPLFDKGAKDVKLSFYEGLQKQQLKGSDVIRRREKAEGICSIETYVLAYNFDRIELSCGNKIKGYVIPKLKKTNGSDQFTFAVDFGTSNTHIEYSVNDGPSTSFSIGVIDQQMVRLHQSYPENPDINAGFLDNNTPEKIGEKEDFKFPLRTAFAEYHKIDYNVNYHTLASANIAFRYEKVIPPKYNKISTDLKWASNKGEQIELFLSNIYMLIRNKVLIDGGDLASTKIIWFYPTSMTEAHFNRFNRLWKKLYTDFFGTNVDQQLVSLSESVAPYSFYKRKRGAKKNVVTIDIGGGTTDVYVVEDGISKMLSSFRFAANSIFGDGYGSDSDNNGFVKLFYDEFYNSLQSNGLLELVGALKGIEDKKVSSDIIAFLFSLSQNPKVQNENIRSLNFLDKLELNTQLKYLFIIFYSAIIYHVALSMKAKGLQMPLTIAFSGNGSRTIKILSSDTNTLRNYFKLIFEEVYKQKYLDTNTLDVVIEENPKVATCKGGILTQKNENFETIDNLKSSLLGIDKTTLSTNETDVYLNSNLTTKLVSEVNEFIEFIFRINSENRNIFINKFDADPSIQNAVKQISRENLEHYAYTGIEQYMNEYKQWGGDCSSSEIKIGETLFFLPIVGMLNNVANKIANKNL